MTIHEFPGKRKPLTGAERQRRYRLRRKLRKARQQGTSQATSPPVTPSPVASPVTSPQSPITPAPIPVTIVTQPVTPKPHGWQNIAARVCLVVGAALLIIAQVGIDVVVPYMQGSQYPGWATTVNDAVPALRNLGTIIAIVGLPTVARASWMHALIAWSLYVGGAYWSWTNTYQWTSIVVADASTSKSDARRHSLEIQYDITGKRKRLLDAQAEVAQVMKDREKQCNTNDGTVCVVFTRKTVPDAVRKETAAAEDLRAAVKEVADATKHEEAAKPANVIDHSKIINSLIPLLGGLLLRLVAL